MITKKEINNYLDSKGIQDTTNEFLVDELIFNIDLGDKIKNEIDKTEIDFKILSKAIDGYSKILRNIINICTKLGITVQDRKKLKLDKTVDAVQREIDAFMNESN